MPKTFGAGFMMSQNTGTNFELVRRHNWEVQIDQFDTVLPAKTVSISRIELENIDVFHYNERIKIAGRPNPTDIRLELHDAVNPNVVQELWNWYKQIYDPNTGAMGYASSYKRQGTIRQYDIAGLPVRTWTCMGLWLKAPPTPEETLDYSSHDPVTLSLVMSCDRISLDGSVAPAVQSGGGVTPSV